MAWPLLLPKKILGIDIGTSAIRIVELSSREKIRLENYGEVESKFLYGKPFRTQERGVLSLSTQDIAKAIVAILKTAKIRTKLANFSLPDFASFFTTFELPPMTKEELKNAIRFEARQHIPLPISEMALDWVLLEENHLEGREENLKVLLVAIPYRVVNQYQEIAKLSGLVLENLEAEVFAFKRAVIGDEEKIYAIIDIGAQSTTCSIVEKKILKMSHSLNISGDYLTEELSRTLEIDEDLAERLKLKYGLSPEGKVIAQVLQPLLDLIIIEVEKILNDFFQTEGKRVEEIILAGKTANLKGIKEYFEEKLKREVRIANPFSKIDFPQILEKILKEIGPSFAIATGVALGSLKQ